MLSAMNDLNFNLKFVSLVEKFPILYNNKIKEYSNDEAREQAWNEIGNRLNITGNESKQRWRNLRSVYVRHQKQAYMNKVKKPYYLGESMKFCLPFIKIMGQTLEDLETTKTESIISSDLPEEAEGGEPPEEEEEIPIFISYPLDLPHDSLSQEDLESEPSEPNFKVKIRKRMHGADVKFIDTKETITKTDVFHENNDKKMFLLSLLPELEPLTESQMRSFRRRVLELIDDISSE